MIDRSRVLVIALDASSGPPTILAGSTECPSRSVQPEYKEIDRYLASQSPDTFDMLIILAEVEGRDYVSVEMLARNEVEGFGAIDPGEPSSLSGTMWLPETYGDFEPHFRPSTEPGSGLANYLYFKALQKFSDKRVGLLHLVSFETISQMRQQLALNLLIRWR